MSLKLSRLRLKVARPRVIFLDAVGTLFDVRGSVGGVYASLCQAVAGVSVDPKALDRAFYEVFRTIPAAAFPGLVQEQRSAAEYDWWYRVALQSFERCGELPKFADFESFFPVLYQHFEAAEPWQIYAETTHALSRWQAQGIALGVISNFDTRLYKVLQALDLARFFQSVTISTEVGAAKPDALIFRNALQKHALAPEAAWHIGDSFAQDYEGAAAAGLIAFWLNRAPGAAGDSPTVRSVASLLELPQLYPEDQG